MNIIANNRPVVIGIDHGFGNVKTSHACFKAGVIAHDKEPTFKSDLLICEGRYYTIGEEHKEFIPDKAGDQERDFRIFQIPVSGIRIENQKIRYFEFISSLQNRDCKAALRLIAPRMDMKKIAELVNTTPYISDLKKTFYLTILTERKEKILDKSLQLLRKRERSHDR